MLPKIITSERLGAAASKSSSKGSHEPALHVHACALLQKGPMILSCRKGATLLQTGLRLENRFADKYGYTGLGALLCYNVQGMICKSYAHLSCRAVASSSTLNSQVVVVKRFGSDYITDHLWKTGNVSSPSKIAMHAQHKWVQSFDAAADCTSLPVDAKQSLQC